MIKVNGQVRIQRDFVGEMVRIDKKQFARACNAFFEKRGIPTLEYKDMIHMHAMDLKSRKKRRKKWEDEEFDYEEEQYG